MSDDHDTEMQRLGREERRHFTERARVEAEQSKINLGRAKDQKSYERRKEVYDRKLRVLDRRNKTSEFFIFMAIGAMILLSIMLHWIVPDLLTLLAKAGK